MKLKNIAGHNINVNGQSRDPGITFEEDNTREVKNLLREGYLEKSK